MSMTREKAIETLRNLPVGLMDLDNEQKWDLTEALDLALTALRGPIREMVERIRGEWSVSYDKLNGLTYVTCSKCGDETVLDGCFVTVEGEPCGLNDFCSACGSPMTGGLPWRMMD